MNGAQAHILGQDGNVRLSTSSDDLRTAYNAGATVWLDLESRSHEAEDLLLNTFQLHPLAVEDIWSTDTTPKVDDYGEYLYTVVQAAGQGRVPDLFEKLDLDIVIGKRFVVTHHRQQLLAIAAVREDLKRSPRLLQKGPPWLAHSILDHLVDDYTPLIDALDASVDQLEHEVVEKAGTPGGRETLGKIFAFKRSLQELRRLSVHQREVLFRLSRGEFPAIPREALPFYRDVFDHIIRAVDLVESYRDLVTSALDVYLSVQSNRMNEIVKTLTLISTLMLPLTFITGLFGMNVKMPGMDSEHALAGIMLILAGTAGLGAFWFKRKQWL